MKAPATPANEVTYRGQYRPRGSNRWTTCVERASESATWDELLATTTLPKNADLRVLRIEEPARRGLWGQDA